MAASTLVGLTRVPNAPLREAFLKSGLTAVEVGRQMGWGANQGSRVKRDLGLLPFNNGDGVPKLRTEIRYQRAVDYARVFDLDPVDAGV